MDTSQIITIGLAIYGAVLSTILGVREWKRSRPSLRVSAKHGYIVDGLDGEPSEPVIVIKVANTGSGSIYLSSTGFTNRGRRGGHQALPSPYPGGILPAELKEGKSITTTYACRWFRERLEHEKVTGPYFQDETGKKWKGRFDKDEKAFCLASVGDGWMLESRNPQNPMILTTRRPPTKIGRNLKSLSNC